jgi:hypothetical protein
MWDPNSVEGSGRGLYEGAPHYICEWDLGKPDGNSATIAGKLRENRKSDFSNMNREF